ncbi:TPA: hypothetical protein ACGE94_000952 [Escherichia coli]|nr:hypothetical protein [Escherichia coli]HBN0441859.1 hypothetical protein [Escherichia coli]HBQ4410348.1 hypothetical protein [Escherichia coli]
MRFNFYSQAVDESGVTR